LRSFFENKASDNFKYDSLNTYFNIGKIIGIYFFCKKHNRWHAKKFQGKYSTVLTCQTFHWKCHVKMKLHRNLKANIDLIKLSIESTVSAPAKSPMISFHSCSSRKHQKHLWRPKGYKKRSHYRVSKWTQLIMIKSFVMMMINKNVWLKNDLLSLGLN